MDKGLVNLCEQCGAIEIDQGKYFKLVPHRKFDYNEFIDTQKYVVIKRPHLSRKCFDNHWGKFKGKSGEQALAIGS